MGASFVNYQVRSADQQAVAAAVAELVQGRAFVSPAAPGGWVTLYDQISERQDAYEIGRLAGELSAKLSTAVLAFVVHDSSLFVYYLFEGGDLLDEYNSSPAPTHHQAGVDPAYWFSGRPELLVNYCPPGTRVDVLAAALARVDTLHESGFASAVNAEQRLKPLAGALRIDLARALRGFIEVSRTLATLPDAAAYLRIDGRPTKNPFRGPVPPRMPPR